MSDGPTEDDYKRAAKAAQAAKDTASAMAPYVSANRLNPALLKRVLDEHAPGNDAADDGIYDQPWLSADTFYTNTECYVELENKLAFKHALDHAFSRKVVP